MPRASDINPKTGKRFDFVDPRAAEAARRAALAAAQAELHVVERKRIIERSRDKLLTYTLFTMPDPVAPDDHNLSAYEAEVFHKAVAEALEAVERGEIPLLIFCMPPRHGKTELATKRFAAWLSGRHPAWNIAVGSYSDTLAADIGADVRAILTSSQHKQVFPEYRLRRGGAAKDNIQTTAGGRLVFVGRGGALTGRGAHVLLLDDLFKDHEEARSPAIRDQAWNWFTKVAMTRRMGKKLVVITMTRWHSDDIIGRLTDPENPYYNPAMAKKWKIIRLAAYPEDDEEAENDPLGRKVGEALWPAKYGRDFLDEQRTLDELGFASLYQQRPTVADGVLFQRDDIRYYERKDLPEDLRIYCASDHAVGVKQRNDFTCLLKVGVDSDHNVYLLECYWRKVKTDVAVEAMLAMGSGKWKPILWWAEKGQISKAIGPFLHKRMLQTRRFINLREITPAVDKEQRAQSIAGMVAMGKVFFPKNAPWANRAIEQMMAFPGGNHDDFVDALAYIGLGLRSQFGKKVKTAKPKIAQPKFGTLAWVKQMDAWKSKQRELAKAGGF